MNRRGVNYDVGAVFSGPGWRVTTRPDFDPGVVRRELEIICTDLHCNAVKIGGTDIGRLMTAAEEALIQGLEVWLSPLLFERSQRQTIANLARAAAAAESLRRRYPGRLVLSAGTESTLFTRGIIPGATITKRLASPANREDMRAGKHNAAVMTYSEEPRYDLDMSGMALVKTYTSGHGTTYQDMTWEPKQAFRAVAGYYAKDSASTAAGD